MITDEKWVPTTDWFEIKLNPMSKIIPKNTKSLKHGLYTIVDKK